MLEAHAYKIMGRPVSTKNSRVLGKGRSFMSRPAQTAITDARQQLGLQHRREPLTGLYDVHIQVWYGNRAGHLDLDNASSFYLDALKKLVIQDDSPRYVRSLHISSEVGPNDYADLQLFEVVK